MLINWTKYVDRISEQEIYIIKQLFVTLTEMI